MRDKLTQMGAALRADGWENVILGLGGTKDPSIYTTFSARAPIADHVLEALYVEDHFAAKVIEALPREAMRPGWDLALPGDPAAAASARTAYAAYEDELEVATNLAQGAALGRLFGGAITWIGIDDGQSPALPVDETKIASVRFLHTYDRRDVQPHGYYQDPAHPRFRRPESYRIRPQIALVGAAIATAATGRMYEAAGTVVHESRLIVWGGQPTTDARRMQLNGWDDSILERCWDALKQIGEDYGAKSLLLGRISQSVYKILNLWKMLAGKEEETLRRRMSLLEASRSRARAILLDTQEAFENITQPLGGVPEMIDKAILRLSSASDTPATVLMGQSPSGENATGESDLEQWATRADTWRTSELRPRHERVTRAILLAKNGPTKGEEPANWEIRYRPLRMARPKELAETREIEARTYGIYIEKALATPEQLAVQLFSPNSGKTDLVLDEDDLREKLERAKARSAQPPKDNAELGTVGARDSALGDLQEAFFNDEIPETAALARLELVFRFSPDDAKRLIARPEGWRPRPRDAATGRPGPNAAPAPGSGAGAPPPLPGFNDGGAR